MQKLEEKIRQISVYYEQMKDSQDWNKKQQLALLLIKLCAEAQKQMQSLIPSAKTFRNKTHLSNIKNAAIHINKQAGDIINKKKRKFDLSSQSKQVLKLSQISQQEKSKRIVRLIVQKQLKSQQLKIPIQQYQTIRNRMQNNLDLMNQAKQLLEQQKQNIDLLQDNIQKMYDNIETANIDLTDAAEQQFRTRIMKMKLGVTGLLVAIGYGILGVPGMIAGGILGVFKMFSKSN